VFGFQDDDVFRRAKDVLLDADFTEDAIGSVLGRQEILTMPSTDMPQVLRRTRDLTRLNTFIRLFFLGVPTPARAVRSALAPMTMDPWVQAELLLPPDADGLVPPLVQIWPVSGFMMAVDLPWWRATAPDPDFVVPPGPLTLALANAMVRLRCEKLLDLGTGSGLLALLGSTIAGSVAATDKNERALDFTRFNARLNQVSNVKCLAGDLFEPVSEERFQLILCNPPFVISPVQRFLFRDSGERGDVFCRRLVQAAVNHLQIGGFFQFTANLAHQEGRSWKADLESWFHDLGCDVLVLVERTETASDYAMNWILGTESKEAALVSKRYEVWMDYFEREKIEAVSYLFINLRKSEGKSNWTQIDDPPCTIVGPCGDELLQFFQCRDRFSGERGVQTLLDLRLKLSSLIRIEQEYAVGSGGLELCRTRLKKTGGLQYPMEIHSNVARLLAGCDGNRTLRQLLQQMADSLGVAFEQALPVVVPAIRSLLERSIVMISEQPDDLQ
jgi:methylase of polypeptide subunit release factors